MSVFSLDYRPDNPVTLQQVDDLGASLGVTIDAKERDDLHRLLAVFHESTEQLMAMDGKLTSSHLHISQCPFYDHKSPLKDSLHGSGPRRANGVSSPCNSYQNR